MIRVLVVDDHPVLRAGLEAVLRAEPGFLAVGGAADGRELRRAARPHRAGRGGPRPLPRRGGRPGAVPRAAGEGRRAGGRPVHLEHRSGPRGRRPHRRRLSPWSRRAPTSISSSTPSGSPPAQAGPWPEVRAAAPGDRARNARAARARPHGLRGRGRGCRAARAARRRDRRVRARGGRGARGGAVPARGATVGRGRGSPSSTRTSIPTRAPTSSTSSSPTTTPPAAAPATSCSAARARRCR